MTYLRASFDDRDEAKAWALKVTAGSHAILAIARMADGKWDVIPYRMVRNLTGHEHDTLRYILPGGEITKLS